MSVLLWILFATGTMSLVALVGWLTLLLSEKNFKKIIYPLVSFSAGAMMGGAFLHMLPEAVKELGDGMNVFLLVLIGFSTFFLLEQFIFWHHCHKAPSEHREPVTYLVLIADAVHNFFDGLAVASAFMINIKLGFVTWLVALSHEIPQELGDFGILIHGGWPKKKALVYNFASALTVIAGGLCAYFLSDIINPVYILPVAAGSIIYIAS
jgi:zinc and cadmium transporter